MKKITIRMDGEVIKTGKLYSFLSEAPYHPIFIGIYPVLVLYYLNIRETVFTATFQAILTSFVITVSVTIFYFIIIHQHDKVALMSSFTLLLILTYGHIFNLLDNLEIFGLEVGHHRYILPAWGGIFAIGWFLIHRLKSINNITKTINTISVFLIGFVLVEIGVYFLQAKLADNKSDSSLSMQGDLQVKATDRDVYYILIDAYSRQDILQNNLDLDTSKFIDGLKDLGFYIPNCAQSNYDYTYSSVTSTLNMNYLDAFGIEFGDDGQTIFMPYIQNSAVRKSFESLGYQTITFKTPHPAIDIKDSTHYFDYFEHKSAFTKNNSINFQYLFINTTLLLPLREYMETKDAFGFPVFLTTWIPSGNSINSREYRQYQQNQFALDTLEAIPALPGKKFIYAHLYSTHQPYVYFPDGRFRPSLPQGSSAYRDQVMFTSNRILEIARLILENSNLKPIIIIQGDHSYFDGIDRLKILNAYYFPDSGDKYLYDTITPVNTFRLVFNIYFGGNFELLPDISKYSPVVNNKVEIHEAPTSCMEIIN